MALVLGTNCGFVSVAPTADPAGAGIVTDNTSRAFRVISSINGSVTQMGYWASNNSDAANFQIGIYSHSGSDQPDVLLGSSGDVAKGTISGWKTASGLNIAIVSGTTYWLALQIDNTTTASSIDTTADATQEHHYNSTNNTSLVNPWGTSTSTNQQFLNAIYAVYETSSVINLVSTSSINTLINNRLIRNIITYETSSINTLLNLELTVDSLPVSSINGTTLITCNITTGNPANPIDISANLNISTSLEIDKLVKTIQLTESSLTNTYISCKTLNSIELLASLNSTTKIIDTLIKETNLNSDITGTTLITCNITKGNFVNISADLNVNTNLEIDRLIKTIQLVESSSINTYVLCRTTDSIQILANLNATTNIIDRLIRNVNIDSDISIETLFISDFTLEEFIEEIIVSLPSGIIELLPSKIIINKLSKENVITIQIYKKLTNAPANDYAKEKKTLPKEADYNNGYFTRYFLRQVNNPKSKILEVDTAQFNKFQSDPFYSNLSIKWKITGNTDNIINTNLNIS